jgi:hypothetical protein
MNKDLINLSKNPPNGINFIWNQNPLATSVVLSEEALCLFKHKIMIDELQNEISEASFELSPKFRRWRNQLRDYNGKKRKRETLKQASEKAFKILEHLSTKEFKQNVDEIVNCYIHDLKGTHYGDCVSQATTCHKCLSENILGINTIPGMSKRMGVFISHAFRSSDGTINGALNYMASYEPDSTINPEIAQNWKTTNSIAHEWLKSYKEFLSNISRP